ncbi:paraquat-inducible protein A [Motilimonas eburnea]|uniref:paraquat-inducible protein A n=1 Tax=Motilimonas eburnea TaxID=1737488 RepID=UPI001E4E4D5A|nr:paraquat-inducible protein A [Motilimonas eburnea]MCE2570342.1 paraquat-inducible protein A [Motilimonas eburnea]
MTKPQLSACSHCDLLIAPYQPQRPQDIKHSAKCPRCGSHLYHKAQCQPSTILALSITALLLLIPANTYPLLAMTMIGTTEKVSLIQATVKLYQEGNFFIALLIFICSTLAPAMMLLSLACASYLSIFHTQSPRLKLFLKWVDHLSHWSMLEVYLVSFLVALIKLVDIADIELGVGLICFSLLMVTNSLILTLFDPSDYWDRVTVNGIS